MSSRVSLSLSLRGFDVSPLLLSRDAACSRGGVDATERARVYWLSRAPNRRATPPAASSLSGYASPRSLKADE